MRILASLFLGILWLTVANAEEAMTQTATEGQSQAKQPIEMAHYWNQCTEDSNCGAEHKCCSTNEGTRCFAVDTCAPAN